MGRGVESLQIRLWKPSANLGIHNRVLKPFFPESLRHATRTAAIAFKRYDGETSPGRATRMHEAAHD